MKPLLDDFDPEMSNVYDECLQGIPHEQYLLSARDLKDLYGSFCLYKGVLTTDLELRKLMVEHDVCPSLLRMPILQIPTEYEVFSGYLLHKAASRDYDLREKVAEQVASASYCL
jgi:hypothetical protein